MPFGPAAIAAAADYVARQRPVAVPTETVYGLAADARDATAVTAIYAAKGRPGFNPLIIHVADLEAAERLALFDPQARALAKAHWPGPLTLVVPARPTNGIAALATAGLASVALRVPAHRAMRALLGATGAPLAAPSANISGRISPTRAAHVVAGLGGIVDLVIDDGPCPHGVESTIIAATNGQLRLLRSGPILVEDSKTSGAHVPHVESPGQLAGHYAPRKPLRLNALQAGANEYMIGFGAIPGNVTLSMTADLPEAAAKLFDLLHQGDASDRSSIAVAPIPFEGLGIAINDRLRRAAS